MANHNLPPVPSERLLREQGIVRWESALRARILGCAVCQMVRCEKKGMPAVFFVNSVTLCLETNPGSVYHSIQPLIEADVLRSMPGMQIKGPGRARVYMGFANNALGEELRASIDPPSVCGLKDKISSVEEYLFGAA
jgi:hypothetical protein